MNFKSYTCRSYLMQCALIKPGMELLLTQWLCTVRFHESSKWTTSGIVLRYGIDCIHPSIVGNMPLQWLRSGERGSHDAIKMVGLIVAGKLIRTCAVLATWEYTSLVTYMCAMCELIRIEWSLIYLHVLPCPQPVHLMPSWHSHKLWHWNRTPY